MGLLDSIEKLINEHGSATILRERIALANDKHAALEEKAADLADQVATLRSDNARLGLDNAELRQQVQRLQAGVKRETATRLPEQREKVLLAVARARELSDMQVAGIVGVGEQVATFHLEELAKAKMVAVQYTMGSDYMGTSGSASWSLDQAGRRYLIEHELIS